MAWLTQCFLFVLAIAAARATVSSIEIFSGNYYGVDEEQGVITIQTSGPSLPDDVNVRPLTTNVDLEQPSNGRAGSHRRGHHHRGRHGHHHRHHHNMTQMPQWSDEQKLTHICAMISPTNSNFTSRRPGRYHGTMLSRKLQMLSAENRQTVSDMWNRRKQDMLRCCNEDSSDRKLQCVNEVRAARYDRVCRGEEPLCPWAQFLSDNGQSRPGSASGSVDSTSNTTATCCMRQGSERLECFGTARALYRQQYEQMKSKMHHGRGSHEERRRTEPDAAARGDDRTPTRRGGGGHRRQRPNGGD